MPDDATLQAIAELRGALMGRMDRIEDRLSAIRDDIGVNMARADRVVDSVAAGRLYDRPGREEAAGR